MKNRAVGFVLVGVFAGCVNLAARALLNLYMSYDLAIVIAYLIALTCAFALNRNYVFKATSGPHLQQYIKFALVNLIAILQVWLVSVAFYRFIFPFIGFDWNTATVSHVIGVASPVLTSFFAYKYFVFPEDRNKNQNRI